MNKNDILKGICVDYTHEGLGIVKVDQLAFFIKDILIGEEIEFVITKLKKSYGFGRCLKILKKSKNRVKPECEYFGKCGGCQLQHMSYQEQLDFKQRLVKNNISRIGNIDKEVQTVIGMDTPLEYRNKAQFPVTIQDKVNVGFYRLHSNDIIDMNHCMIQSPLINEIMFYIKTKLKEYKFNNVFRHLLIKHAFATNEVMIVFITKIKGIANLDTLVLDICKKFPMIKSVVLNVNKENNNVILGKEEYVLYGNKYIVDELDGLKFNISSKSFYQVNSIQTRALYQKAIEFADITSNDNVIDIYCGIGTISLFLARKAKKVIGIEIVEEAIEDAKRNAKINHIDNVEFICSDAAKYGSYLVEQNNKPDVVIVDPPRKGCDQLTLESIRDMNPQRIVYISCDSATLARDLNILESFNYHVENIQPVDMFPNTYHVECVVLMTKVK